jgi:hypothetical protein
MVCVHLLRMFSIPSALRLSLSEQTFLFDTRKLGLQENLLHLGLDGVRGYREGSVSRAAMRRRNHVRIHRRSFDHLLVTWAFRISRIHRFIPHSTGRRHHSPCFAFRLREKGQRLNSGCRTQDPRQEQVCSLSCHFFADSGKSHRF